MTAALALNLAWPPPPASEEKAIPDPRLLGGLIFGLPAVAGNDSGVQRVAMPPLDPAQPSGMAWLSGDKVRAGHHGTLAYRHTDAWLFGVLTLDEADFAAQGETTALQNTAETAYRTVFEALDTLGYPGLLRIWAYLPRINAIEGGTERYRQFNAGRQKGFAAAGRALDRDMPAACVLGTAYGPLTLAFLAGRQRPQGVENPRQISAWRYPKEYGARSPLFSRAAFARCGHANDDGILLFISGTASIVGHATRHIGDVAAQTRETLANIDAVLDEAGKMAGVRFRAETLAYIAYVRHRSDLPTVRDIVRAHLGDSAHVTYVQADVCRADLLVEIEASGGHSIEIGP